MTIPSAYRALADRVDAARARDMRQRLAPATEQWPGQHAAATLLATAYPALARTLLVQPSRMQPPQRQSLDALRRACAALHQTPERLPARLRRLAHDQRMRIALRELLPAELGGADIEETARELSDLAEATIQCALDHAQQLVFTRLGAPRYPDGRPGAISIIGMGKLGGGELNAGSDVDLVCFYDSDVCVARTEKRDVSAHHVWSKVIQQLAATLGEPSEEGIVWRVDLRLRPEGARGPLVNSLAAAERYYEDYGRLWERAAMLRARPVAGDNELGRRVIAMMTPFIWRRSVDPTIAAGIYQLVHRARTELSRGAQRNLKLGSGGIREAEMFVQTLQLIWGGREPRIRCRPTIEAAMRLQAAGFMSERETDELAAAYLALRRCEHALQFSSGVQTHSLPAHDDDLARLARTLGFAGAEQLQQQLAEHMRRVEALFASLLSATPTASRWRPLLRTIERGDRDAFDTTLRATPLLANQATPPFPSAPPQQLSHDLWELARNPDSLLGARTRERHPHLAEALLEALAGAADTTQAVRFLRSMSLRVRHAAVYARLLADDPAALQRLVTVFGGSAYVAGAVSAKPALLDLILFEAATPTPAQARREVLQAAAAGATGLDQQHPSDGVIEHLRRAKARVTTQVALADLGGEMTTPQAQLVLSALADAQLEMATRHALRPSQGRGMCLIAMGSLGALETGYGSDLDVMFVFDGHADVPDPVAYFSRAARRIIQMVSMAHPAGRGYVLDARLRPSGNQGLLVVSLDAFARYHGLSQPAAGARPSARQAAAWERIALVRARFAAGDVALGKRALALIRRVTYQRPIDAVQVAAEVDRVRRRMQCELSRERSGRRDIKLGRGGMLEAQLATQLLQLRCRHRDVWHSDTRGAIAALGAHGVIDGAFALRGAYDFLSRLEQRLRVLHADDSCLLEEDAAGLVPLARRMGLRDLPRESATKSLMARYRHATDIIHRFYRGVVSPSGQH